MLGVLAPALSVPCQSDQSRWPRGKKPLCHVFWLTRLEVEVVHRDGATDIDFALPSSSFFFPATLTMDPNFNWLESLEHTQQAIRRTQPPAPEPCDHPDRVPGSDDEEEDLEATSAGVRRPEAGPSVGRGTGLAGRAGPLRDVRPGVNALPEGAGLGPGTPVSGEYVQRGPARPKALPRESPGAGVELARRTQFGISGEGASDCSYWVVQWSAGLFVQSSAS